jgi:hypothetical protein
MNGFIYLNFPLLKPFFNAGYVLLKIKWGYRRVFMSCKNYCRPQTCLTWFPWMLVNQMYTGHRGKGQEYSLGVPRSGCESGVKFLHWILFRINAHLGKISASYNIVRLIVFWFWLVALGAILYQMPGLHLNIRLYNTVGFAWLYSSVTQ